MDEKQAIKSDLKLFTWVVVSLAVILTIVIIFDVKYEFVDKTAKELYNIVFNSST